MKRINIYLKELQIAFLVGLTGSISEHIRRAIDEYIEKQKNLKISASASQPKGGNING